MVMYKIDRRGGAWGVQKSFSRTDPTAFKGTIVNRVIVECIEEIELLVPLNDMKVFLLKVY